MRELKFRVFDKPQGKFLESESQDKGIPFNISYYAKTYLYIVEQYTGLKDKNGVEIYEGDILSRRMYKEHVGDDRMTYMLCKKFLSKSGLTIGFRYLGLSGNTGMCFENAETFEIIGNIHQNPELLKD